MHKRVCHQHQNGIVTGTEQNYGIIDLTGTSSTVPNPGDFVPKPAFNIFAGQ